MPFARPDYTFRIDGCQRMFLDRIEYDIKQLAAGKEETQMRALVIGGTGPTGPFIVNGLLNRGFEVAILHRGTHEAEFGGAVEDIHGDPHFKETLEEALGNRTFDMVIATYGRLRLVAEVMKGRTPRLIAVGGARVYKVLSPPPDSPVGVPIPLSEDLPLNDDPVADKFTYLMATTEQAVMQIHNERYYNATILRYPQIYGPRQLRPQDWCIIRRILDGRKRLILPDAGMALQSRCYAENAAHGVLLAVDKPEESKGQIYNITDEQVISLRERIEIVSRVMNHSWEFVNMPGKLARPSRAYSSGPFHVIFDISKIKNQLGYRDVVPLEEGIRRTVNFYLENRPEPGGNIETNLRDTFDYETEDRFMDEFRVAEERVMKIDITRAAHFHPYAHPKKPGELTDHKGR